MSLTVGSSFLSCRQRGSSNPITQEAKAEGYPFQFCGQFKVCARHTERSCHNRPRKRNKNRLSGKASLRVISKVGIRETGKNRLDFFLSIEDKTP